MVLPPIPLPSWSSRLAPLYWQLRRRRSLGKSFRGLYPKIAKVKAELLESGVPYIEIHLVCRILTSDRFDPIRQINAGKRYLDYVNRNGGPASL